MLGELYEEEYLGGRKSGSESDSRMGKARREALG